MTMLLAACGATNGWDALIAITLFGMLVGGVVALAFWMLTHE
jgi:Flp pilus assembly protein protease CpaA